MGTVYNRAKTADGKPDKRNPKWWCGYKDLDGEWKYVPSGMPSKEQAKLFLNKLEANVAAGRVGIERRTEAQLCGALLDQWSESLENRDAKGDRYRLEKHLRPMFGKTNIRDVTRAAILDWVQAQKAGTAPRTERPRKPVTPSKAEAAGRTKPGPKPRLKLARPKREPGKRLAESSIRHNLNLLSRFLGWCVEHDHILHNAVRDIRQGSRPKQAAKKVQPWLESDADVRKLMAELPEPIDLMFYVANRSGLRTGEVCGLRLSDLGTRDANGNPVIRVRHSYEGPLKEDKAGTGKVKWAVEPDDVADRLAVHLKRRKAEHAKPEDFVFQAPAGGHFSRMAIHRAWVAACQTVGVELTWYQATRHSFASGNLTAGVLLDDVSGALGHSSPTVTRRYYDHLTPKTFSAGLRAGLSVEP